MYTTTSIPTSASRNIPSLSNIPDESGSSVGKVVSGSSVLIGSFGASSVSSGSVTPGASVGSEGSAGGVSSLPDMISRGPPVPPLPPPDGGAGGAVYGSVVVVIFVPEVIPPFAVMVYVPSGNPAVSMAVENEPLALMVRVPMNLIVTSGALDVPFIFMLSVLPTRYLEALRPPKN